MTTKFNPQVFTIFKNTKKQEDGSETVTLSMRPKFGKFGVKSITVELNDGSLVELDDNSVFFANDPRERLERKLKNGKLTEEEMEEQVGKLDSSCISKEVTLLVK